MTDDRSRTRKHTPRRVITVRMADKLDPEWAGRLFAPLVMNLRMRELREETAKENEDPELPKGK